MRRSIKILLMITVFAAGSAPIAQAWDAAHDCANVKNPTAAIAGCSELIDSGRGNNKQRAEVFYLRGVAHANLKQWDQALKDYNQAIDLDPSRVDFALSRIEGYLFRGESRLNKKNYSQAAEDFNLVIRMASDDSGKARHGAQRIANADQTTILLSARGDAHFDLGFIARDQGDSGRANKEFDKAAEIYGSVIARSSTNFEAYHQRARIHLIQHRYKQASEDFDQAAALLKATLATTSDPQKIHVTKNLVKDWLNQAEYSKTKVELDARYADYLNGIEKDHNYPNWLEAPGTAFRRLYLQEAVPSSASVRPAQELAAQPSLALADSSKSAAEWIPLLCASGAFIVMTTLALSLIPPTRTREPALIRSLVATPIVERAQQHEEIDERFKGPVTPFAEGGTGKLQ